jgi:hypothetical protein
MSGAALGDFLTAATFKEVAERWVLAEKYSYNNRCFSSILSLRDCT